jgi:hypothetical protein
VLLSAAHEGCALLLLQLPESHSFAGIVHEHVLHYSFYCFELFVSRQGGRWSWLRYRAMHIYDSSSDIKHKLAIATNLTRFLQTGLL